MINEASGNQSYLLRVSVDVLSVANDMSRVDMPSFSCEMILAALFVSFETAVPEIHRFLQYSTSFEEAHVSKFLIACYYEIFFLDNLAKN